MTAHVHYRGIGVGDLGQYRDQALRGTPVHGVRRGRRLLALATLFDATGCAGCSLSDLSPDGRRVFWNYLTVVQDGRRRFVVSDDRVVVFDDQGSRTIRWSDLDDTQNEVDKPTLFDLGAAAASLAPPAAVTHRATQWAAARSVRSDKVKLGQQCTATLLALDRFGDEGACADQIAAIVQNAANRVSSRAADLCRLGLAESTGLTVKAQSGLNQKTWRATAAGRELAAQLREEPEP